MGGRPWISPRALQRSPDPLRRTALRSASSLSCLAQMRGTFMNEAIQVRQHQWVEMKVTAIDIVHHEGVPTPVPIGAEPRVTYGCFACNMGLAEGSELTCPGEDLFDEGG